MNVLLRPFCFALLLLSEGAFADLDVIEGEWTNSSNLIAITRSQSFGWNLWQDNKGRASIVQSSEGGGNITVTFKGGVVCNYYVSTTNHGRKMTWSLQSPSQGASSCLSGVFEKIDASKKNQSDDFSKTPANAVEDGIWYLKMQCSDGKSVGRLATFRIGRTAVGATDGTELDVNMSYSTDGRLKLIGSIGTDGESLTFNGAKNNDGSYSGPGKVGGSDCTIKATFFGDGLFKTTPSIWLSNDKITVGVRCPGMDDIWFNDVSNLYGIGAFGYKMADNYYVPVYFKMGFNEKSLTTGLFQAYWYTKDGFNLFNFNLSRQPNKDNSMSWKGSGTFAGRQGCSIFVRSP